MSLYLPEQKLGSRSSVNSSSHKFMLKGRQTGGMHRGHAWVFRAESYDTMMAWYEDIKNLTEKTGEERNAFVRRHARSISGGSHKAGSVSSDGVMDEDEADAVPFLAHTSHVQHSVPREDTPARPQPGGRFPSDLQVNRFLQAPLSPSSATSSGDRDPLTAADAQAVSSASPGPGNLDAHEREDPTYGPETKRDPGAIHGASRSLGQLDQPDSHRGHGNGPDGRDFNSSGERTVREQQTDFPVRSPPAGLARRDTDYATWMAPGVAGNGVPDARTYPTESYQHRPRQDEVIQHHGNRHTSNSPDTGEVTGTSTASPISGGQSPDGKRTKNAYSTSASQPSQAGSLSTDQSFQVDGTLNESTTNHAGTSNIGSNGDETIESVPAAAGQSRELQTRDEAVPLGKPITLRPSVQSPQSVQTISDMHVPGEFPPTPVI